MKTLMSIVCATVATLAVAEELKTLSEADKALLARNYNTLTEAERQQRQVAADLRYLIEEGGAMNFPGTPRGKIRIVNLQKRVPTERLLKLRNTFTSMMAYDLDFTDKDGEASIVVRIVDKPDGKSLTVWPDDGHAEVNVAALAADNPKPAFLAARVRKEIIRAFSCATCGSTYEAPLFGHVRNAKALDDIASEDFTIDVIMRTTSYLKNAGVIPLQPSTYREVLESGYDVAPTNGYQKAIYEEVKKTTKLTKKLP